MACAPLTIGATTFAISAKTVNWTVNRGRNASEESAIGPFSRIAAMKSCGVTRSMPHAMAKSA
jgi:hypothetical protein